LERNKNKNNNIIAIDGYHNDKDDNNKIVWRIWLVANKQQQMTWISK
jgi:hypothetical protein